MVAEHRLFLSPGDTPLAEEKVMSYLDWPVTKVLC